MSPLELTAAYLSWDLPGWARLPHLSRWVKNGELLRVMASEHGTGEAPKFWALTSTEMWVPMLVSDLEGYALDLLDSTTADAVLETARLLWLPCRSLRTKEVGDRFSVTLTPNEKLHPRSRTWEAKGPGARARVALGMIETWTKVKR